MNKRDRNRLDQQASRESRKGQGLNRKEFWLTAKAWESLVAESKQTGETHTAVVNRQLENLNTTNQTHKGTK